jgi:hypothetical protein
LQCAKYIKFLIYFNWRHAGNTMLQLAKQNEGKLSEFYLRACLLTINSVSFSKFPYSSSFSVFNFKIRWVDNKLVEYIVPEFTSRLSALCTFLVCSTEFC